MIATSRREPLQFARGLAPGGRGLFLALVVVALLPSAYIVLRAPDMPFLGQFHDDGIYFVCAKSLAEGTGYRIVSLPERPFETKYPPLYPLLLSAVWRSSPDFPENLRLASWLGWAFLPLWVLLGRQVLFDAGLAAANARLVTVLLAFHPIAVILSLQMMTDLLGATLVFAVLILAERSARPGAHLLWAVAAGAVAGICFLTRNATAPLLVCGPLWYGLRRQRTHAAAYSAAAAPAVAGWVWWSAAHQPAPIDSSSLYYISYTAYYAHMVNFANLSSLLWGNAKVLCSSLGGLICPPLVGHRAAAIVSPFFAAVGVIGVGRLAQRTGLRLYHLYAVGVTVLSLLWNFPPTVRLLFPLTALLLSGFTWQVGGIFRVLWSYATTRRDWRGLLGLIGTAGLAVLLVLVTSETAILLLGVPRVVAQRRASGEGVRRAYTWIAANTPRDAAFLAFRDPMLYLYTGRRAVRLQAPSTTFYEADRARVLGPMETTAAFARRRGLGYLLVTDADFEGDLQDAERADIRRSIQRHTQFRLIYETAGAAVYVIGRAERPPGATE